MPEKTKLLMTPPPKDPASEPARNACLVHIYPTGPSMGKRYTLGESSLSLGRDESCDIVIDDTSVSRRHATVQPEADDSYSVIDLQSTNGTFVNNERVTRSKLTDGDYLGIGTCIYHFLSGSNLEASFHEEIYKLTITDALTEINNKRYLLDFLERALVSAHRNRRPLSLVMFDIDFFKAINDRMGHLAGDFALRELASVIKVNIRTQDLFARYGGEEFALVLPETTFTASMAMAERLRRQVEAHVFQFDGKPYPLTVSLGVAGLGEEEKLSALEFIQRADTKLYQAKREGRNRVVG